MIKILERDDPLLRQVAEPIHSEEFHALWLKKLVNDLLAVMKEKGAVGVAAPQIGVSKRVLVFGTNYSTRRKPVIPIPETILINPVLTLLTENKDYGYEGCLNSGGFLGLVPRASEIEYSGYSQDGQLITKKASGLEARILQHEVDHLDGILFFDRVEDQTTIVTYEEFEKRSHK